MGENAVSQPVEKIGQPIRPFSLAKESILYGIRNFYKVGFWWWVFIVIYAVFSVFFELEFPEHPRGLQPFLDLIKAILFIVVIHFPIYVLGISFIKRSNTNLRNVWESLPQFGKYLLGHILFLLSLLVGAILCFFLTFVLSLLGFLVVYIFGTNIGSLLGNIFGTIIGVIIYTYWICRVFPYPFVILEKKVNPIWAFQHSLEITSSHFRPIFFLLLPVALMEILSGFTFGVASLFTAPFGTLATIYAYKRLDQNCKTST